MKLGIIVLVACWIFALVLHLLKIVLTKKYDVAKKNYDEYVSNIPSGKVVGNYKKVKIEMFHLYVKSLGQGTILLLLMGVFAFIRELLK
jgi:hypothetical protein